VKKRKADSDLDFDFSIKRKKGSDGAFTNLNSRDTSKRSLVDSRSLSNIVRSQARRVPKKWVKFDF
jgi:hypothetical protein